MGYQVKHIECRLVEEQYGLSAVLTRSKIPNYVRVRRKGDKIYENFELNSV